MFDQLLTRITSPNTKRRHTYHCSQGTVQTSPEVHSDPENEPQDTPRRPRLLERRRRGRRGQESGMRQARSLGRLDGLKENEPSHKNRFSANVEFEPQEIRGKMLAASHVIRVEELDGFGNQKLMPGSVTRTTSVILHPYKAERLADYSRLLGGSQPALVDGRRKDLDRIQDLFPQDFLGLHDPDAATTQPAKSKSTRKRSLNISEISDRMFIMEAPCVMACPRAPHSGRPRHLFLFSDLLLVAKPRSGGSFKLKESVRVSELWLASCPESETGFLIGWPAPARTLQVTFATQAARDSWWRELQNALSTQLRNEPPTTNIKVVYRDPLSGTECSKTLGVGPEMSSTEIARLALDDNISQEWNYTLWAKDRDNAPCPLLGCERPHSIQLARLRQSLCAEEGFDLAHCNSSRSPCGIVFELKPNTKPTPRKTPLKLFRKSNCRFFGAPLSRLCTGGTLPPVLNTILRGLFQRGPHTQGIFRRCASAKALRELRERIDSVGPVACEELLSTPALVLAALLKDFLRSLPEPLLSGPTVSEWLAAADSGRIEHIRRLILRLPRENHVLLAHVVCVLYHIARRARYNLMSPANLGVCVGPSMLWENGQNGLLSTLPQLIELFITQCQSIFGPQVTSLFGEPASDSGAEESDSLHSLGLSLDSMELSKDQKSLSRDSGLTLSEDDRESPGLSWGVPFHRSDWSRQAARVRSLDCSWAVEEDEAFCASSESLCSPPVPPRRPPPLRHLPPVHLPPVYRPPPPPPPTYATARLLLVTDAESESYV